MKIYVHTELCVGFMLCVSCSKNPFVRKVDHIPVSLTVIDFHKKIEHLSQTQSTEQTQALLQECGPFFESFNVRIMKLGLSTDSAYFPKLADVMSKSWMKELYADVEQQYPDNAHIQQELTNAFQYYMYYFPDFTPPRIASFISGLQYSIVIDEDMLAIGLDKYLGENYIGYIQAGIASFMRRGMHKERIPVDCMIALADAEFPYNFSDEFLLSYIIHHGRQMYLVRSVLPHVHDTVLWAYTEKQLDFCKKSENQFWKYLVSENTLYSSDYLTIKRFVEDGPFTHVFTKQSPGRVGQWIGYNIVASFMNKNPEISMEELFSIQDAQEIMNKARYRP